LVHFLQRAKNAAWDIFATLLVFIWQASHPTLHYDAPYFPDLRRGAHRHPAAKVFHGIGLLFC